MRYFWAAWHHGVEEITNAHWSDEPPNVKKPALYYEEAFWSSDRGWLNGHGDEAVVQGDGFKWPRGTYMYGRYESAAEGVPWMWYVHGWDGADDQIWDKYAVKREPMDH